MVGGGDLQFGVLGPVEVTDAGKASRWAGRSSAALLADLILNAGRSFPSRRLIDDLWGDAPPPDRRPHQSRPTSRACAVCSVTVPRPARC